MATIIAVSHLQKSATAVASKVFYPGVSSIETKRKVLFCLLHPVVSWLAIL